MVETCQIETQSQLWRYSLAAGSLGLTTVDLRPDGGNAELQRRSRPGIAQRLITYAQKEGGSAWIAQPTLGHRSLCRVLALALTSLRTDDFSRQDFNAIKILDLPIGPQDATLKWPKPD